VAGEHGRAVTSDYVLAEALNFVRQRVKSEAVARTLDGDVFGRAGHRPIVRDVLRVHGGVFASALDAYRTRWKAGLSFTDWTTVELARVHHIDAVASFDQGFAAWLDVVPTSSSSRRSRSRSAR
jgi:predicted nucleic acid-binding protein